jgi:hypothetical protein
MGVMKRLVGWRMSGWPIFGPLQVIAGLREERDPEAWKEPTFHHGPPAKRSSVAKKQGELFQE